VIVLCANDTSWDYERDRLVPGGQGDRYLTPILRHLPKDARIMRQPVPGTTCALMNHWATYRRNAQRDVKVSVMISHGIADKNYRSAWRAVHYTYTVYPGPALADRAIADGLDPRRVRVLGYPKLDPIFAGEVVSPWPERDGRIRVLWAPTHGGGSERFPEGRRDAPGAQATTWWHRDTILRLLDPDRHLVMEAPHPRHSPGRQATFAQYVGADVVIADGGSTIYESWALGLPVVFPRWLTAHRNLTRAGGRLLEHDVYERRAGWHADSPDQLADLVDRAAAEGISDLERRFAHWVLPEELRGHGGKLHAEFLMEVDSGSAGDLGRPASSRHRARQQRVAVDAARRRLQLGP